MIDELFHCHLRESGHRPLRDFYRVKALTTSEDILERLREQWEGVHSVMIPWLGWHPKAIARINAVEKAIMDGDHQFSPWTSWEDSKSRNIHFAFRSSRDAVMFRLLLPDS